MTVPTAITNGTVAVLTPVSLYRCPRGVGLAAPGTVLRHDEFAGTATSGPREDRRGPSTEDLTATASRPRGDSRAGGGHAHGRDRSGKSRRCHARAGGLGSVAIPGLAECAEGRFGFGPGRPTFRARLPPVPAIEPVPEGVCPTEQSSIPTDHRPTGADHLITGWLSLASRGIGRLALLSGRSRCESNHASHAGALGRR